MNNVPDPEKWILCWSFQLKMVGWEQISHLFIDYDHNNLQFWILKPQWTYQPGIADVARELRSDIHPVSGSSLNRLKSRNPYGNPIEITTWCWMPRIVPSSAMFPFSGPDLSHRWPFSPMAFGAFSPTIWRDFIGGEVKIVQQQVLPAHGLGTEEPEESSLNVP